MSIRGELGARAAVLVAASLVLRAWGIGDIQAYTGDEHIHVPAAHAFATGQRTENEWFNPPLPLLLLEASMAVAGDRPTVWRTRDVVLGSLSPLLLVLLGLALFPDRSRVAWVAGWLLAVDPLHILLARGTFSEVTATFFFLVAAWAAALAARGRRTLLVAGVALGCAFASKHYFELASLVLVGYVLSARSEEGARPPPSYVLTRLVLVPGAVYVATYLPWFGRGYGLVEFVQYHLDALHMERIIEFMPTMHEAGIAPRWFVSTGLVSSMVEQADGWTRYHLIGRNVPAFLATLPAVAATAVGAIRRRSRPDLLVAALFIAVYVPLLLLPRAIFVYSAIAVIPLAFLAIARVADGLLDRHRAVAAGALAVLFAFGLCLYPLVTLKAVPDWLYGPLLDWITLH
ncbi:MAG TPA: glycosyltransferase family 39 protein [Anaeromyxobacter sp.]